MPNDDPNLIDENETGNNSIGGSGGTFDDPVDLEETEEETEDEGVVVEAISQSEWWKKIYNDENNSQTAKHLI